MKREEEKKAIKWYFNENKGLRLRFNDDFTWNEIEYDLRSGKWILYKSCRKLEYIGWDEGGEIIIKCIQEIDPRTEQMFLLATNKALIGTGKTMEAL